MRFKIVADSSSNQLAFSGADYASVPLKVITGRAEYVDDAHLDVDAMVEEIRHTGGKSHTSCPNVHEWMEAFGDAEEIFAIAITSKLSGSFDSARQAAQAYQELHPSAKICVVDSLSTGPEMALLVEKLAQLRGEGCDFDRMAREIDAYRQRTHLLFCLQSMTNLARNGRVSPAVAKIAGVLGIRVVGRASDEGVLQQLHKSRGERRALAVMRAEMEKRGFSGGKVRIDHCQNPEGARAMEALIRERFPDADVRIGRCGALCCFYAEQGGLLIGFEGP